MSGYILQVSACILNLCIEEGEQEETEAGRELNSSIEAGKSF